MQKVQERERKEKQIPDDEQTNEKNQSLKTLFCSSEFA